MKRVIKYEWLLIFGFFITIIFMNIPVGYTIFYHDITGVPEAVDGIMNLSTVSLSERKINLDGQWEFFWKNFIVSEKKDQIIANFLITIPDEWSSYKVNGKKLSAEGYGSYRLTLTGIEYENTVTLYVPDFSGAYRVFIDGQLASESGIISSNINKIFTVPKAELYPIKLSSHKTHEVVIEVATTRFSGLYMTPVLSDYNKLIYDNSNRIVVRFIFFGIILYSLFSLLVMYVASARRKLYSFWLPIMIFFILIRIMLTSEFYSVWQSVLFFNLPFEATNELMYFTTFVLKYLLIFLVQEQCGIKFMLSEKIGFLVYYIFLFLLYLFTPQGIYNQYLSVIVPMLTYVLDFFLFTKIYNGRKSIIKYGMVVFWGAIFVIVGLTIDSYYINGKIYMNASLALIMCFTVFAIIMNWIYAMRGADIYDKFTNSSARLELASGIITMQKEYYDTLSRQMNEIREIKHDIHHFVGVINALTEENKFIELKAFLQEYSEKTKIEQLPVFCENIVANSIIGYYYLKAKKYDIQFESICIIDRQFIISDSDLCIILGNSLENSIYACIHMGEHENRYVDIKTRTIKGQILFQVKNSYIGSIKMIDGHYVSSKADIAHGFGIGNINRVVVSYGGFMNIEHNEREFTLMIAIPEK